MSTTIRIIIQVCFDLAVFGVMLGAAIQDWKTKIVNPKLQIALLAISGTYAIYTLIAGSTSGGAGIIDGAFPWDGFWLIISGVLMWTIYVVIAHFSGGKGIGGADAKVTSIMALYLGLIQSIIMTVTHLVAALIYKLIKFIKNKETIVSVRLMPFILIGYTAVKIGWWILFIVKLVPTAPVE